MIRTRTLLRRCGAVGLLFAIGCSAHGMAGGRVPATGVHVANLPTTASDNFERLGRLAAERRMQPTGGDYLLGPGDLLSVRAINLDELTQRVRVEVDGTITLPLVGSVPVGGKTLTEAQRDLTRRAGEFMYDPHVTLFVEEYRSQQVGVVGAVQRPGLVSLTGNHATVLDALSAAGGMTSEAGGRLYLIPGRGRAPSDAPSGIVPAVAQDGAAGSAEDGPAPIMLDVKELGEAAQGFFALPVRAGDVIMVPSAGEFIVDGWVAKPGNYPIKSSLTLRGAIAIGGGASFPADKTRVRIYRLAADGKTETHDVDYAAVLAERVPDVLVHDGDVIEVGYSAAKLVPYAVYKLAVDIVHVGAGIRVVP